MSRTLIAHVSLWAPNGELVALAPGDDVPEWATGRVGEHCFAAGQDAPEADGPDEPDETDEAETVAKPKSKSAAPDFTAPAPRRGRPRK